MITLKLISAEIKKSTKLIIPFLIGIVISIAVLAAAVFLCTKFFSQEDTFKKQVIAISAPDNDNLLSAVISSVEKMDSVKEICTFEYTDSETAVKMLESGKASTAVIIPENFIKSIVYGENVSAEVLYTKGSGTGHMLTKELLDCGAKMLGNSQAGIYSFIDVYEATYSDGIPKDVLFDVNLSYLEYIMSRKNIFEYEKLSPTGELSVIEFFASSACLVFMLMTGIICSLLFSDSRNVIWKKLKIYGINSIWRTIFKLLSVFALILISLVIFILFLLIAEKTLDYELLKINLKTIFSLLSAAFCVSAFVVFIYHLTYNQIAGVLLLFISSVSMIFLCGGFVPSALLPQILVKIGRLMPAKPMIDVLGSMFLNSCDIQIFYRLFIWSGIFILGSITALKLREE